MHRDGVRVCMGCGEVAINFAKDQKYCSPICRKKYKIKLSVEHWATQSQRVYKPINSNDTKNISVR